MPFVESFLKNQRGKMQNKFKSLISLLDDSNIEVVQEAMAELLRHETEIEEYLAQHQESSKSLRFLLLKLQQNYH